jgi:dihydrofolate reductase
MAKLRVQSFAISIDGFGAGPNQDIENPLGVRGPELFDWFFATRVWRRMHGLDDGETGIDNEIAEQGFAGIGAWILGRNMFGPIRGPWPDENWRGWWGEDPPYHAPVFVLTNYSRAPVKMKGGTEFRFVTEGIHAALDQATEAAGGHDVRLGGGVATIRQYLRAALIDEMHLAVRPILLGSGEHLFNGLDLHAIGYECAKHIAGERAMHVFCGSVRDASGPLSVGTPNIFLHLIGVPLPLRTARCENRLRERDRYCKGLRPVGTREALPVYLAPPTA